MTHLLLSILSQRRSLDAANSPLPAATQQRTENSFAAICSLTAAAIGSAEGDGKKKNHAAIAAIAAKARATGILVQAEQLFSFTHTSYLLTHYCPFAKAKATKFKCQSQSQSHNALGYGAAWGK
jgi:hypothetical protein